MPQTRRAWEPGDIWSIVGRAHEGRPVFATDNDRRSFVDGLRRRVFVVPAVDLLASALTIDHRHVVIRAGRRRVAALVIDVTRPPRAARS